MKKKLEKLKKEEHNLILKKVEIYQSKERKYLDNKIKNNYELMDKHKKKEATFFKKKIEMNKKSFNEHQEEEKKNFRSIFEASYPKEKSPIQEINEIKKRIKYFIDLNEYEKAQKLTDLIKTIKEKRHKEYLNNKEKEYNYASQKFENGLLMEKQRNIENVQNKIFEFNYNKKKEFDNFEFKKNIKNNQLKNIHFNELENIQNNLFVLLKNNK